MERSEPTAASRCECEWGDRDPLTCQAAGRCLSESAATTESRCPGCGRPVSECRAEDVDESFPAKSRTDVWLKRAQWFRHNVLYPLVVLSAIIWLVRQVTA